MSSSFYTLFESASGYGLFSILESEEIGSLLSEVQASINDLPRFQKIVKMVAFHPFDSAENALENINAITEHELTNDLRVSIDITNVRYIYIDLSLLVICNRTSLRQIWLKARSPANNPSEW